MCIMKNKILPRIQVHLLAQVHSVFKSNVPYQLPVVLFTKNV